MESAQKDLLSVLLGDIYSRGLISKSTYLKGEDLLHSFIDFPDFFVYPVCLTKEADENEHTENPQ